MRLFEYAHRLKAYLTEDGRVPYDTGNLQEHGFKVKTLATNEIGLIMGDPVQVPYAILLETGYKHKSGRIMNRHKGWASRGAREFAEILAKELGGEVREY